MCALLSANFEATLIPTEISRVTISVTNRQATVLNARGAGTSKGRSRGMAVVGVMIGSGQLGLFYFAEADASLGLHARVRRHELIRIVEGPGAAYRQDRCR